jgi:hypothetical protein
MKKVFCLLMFFALSGCGDSSHPPSSSAESSQPATSKPVESANGASEAAKSSQPGTKLEAFLGKRGLILVKDIYDVGRVKGLGNVEMKALVMYEVGSSQTMKGLRVEVTESGSLERSSISFIDMDELQSLEDAISYVSDLSKKWEGQSHAPYTEITYISKGEFDLGFFQQGTKASAYVSSGNIGKATAFLQTGDLEQMKEMVGRAVILLNSK